MPQTVDKQLRPISDATNCGQTVASEMGLHCLFTEIYGKYSKNENFHLKPLKLEMDSLK